MNVRPSEKRYDDLQQVRMALDEASILAITDAKGRIIEVNTHFCRLSGYDRDELIGRTHRVVNSRHHPRSFFRTLWETIRAGQIWRGEIKNRAKDGREYWVSTVIVPVLGADGRPERYVSIRHDVTAHKQAEQSLRRAQENLALAQQAASLGSWEWDLRSGALAISDEGRRILGLPEWSGPLTLARVARFLPKQTRRQALRQFNLARRRQDRLRFETVVAAADGGEALLRSELVCLRDGFGHAVGLAGTIQDITAERETQRRLESLSQREQVTGLPNRRFFRGSLARLAQRCIDSGGRVALLFLDLDRFGDINEEFGHAVGDSLLRVVAERLRGAVGDGNLLAHLGSDEFAVVMDGISGVGDAAAMAHKLVRSMEAPASVDGHVLYCGASVGFSLLPQDASSMEALQSQAGLALAAAKAAGRNAFRRYTLDMGVANARRVALLRHLRGALAARQFVVRYQPQVRLDNGRLHGVEALLRWEHPDLGLVGPDEFVPLLEEAGAIEAVGAWVMEHAARDAQVWAEAGHPLRVAVNVSPRQLTSGTLTGVVEAVLRGTGLAGSCLELEVTESTLTVDPTRVADQLQRVRELGVTVSIDDFGTGYSSLGRLKQFPVDVLKIDKCFTADLLEGSHDAAIITAIVSLARNLGMKVVAEGIERPDVAEVLRSLRCDTGQGFLFGRPMSAAHIAALSRRAPEWR